MREKILRKNRKIAYLINNTNVINFINKLRTNTDKVRNLTEPMPFDANDINNRNKSLLIYQILDENNNRRKCDFGIHHNNCIDKLKNQDYKNMKIACGYVYSGIVFLGNNEANEF